MLDVSDLVTAYGKIEALKGVTLHAERGRITCLLGPNGAGKTTLMMSIAGILQPQRGSIQLEGVEYRHQPPGLQFVGDVIVRQARQAQAGHGQRAQHVAVVGGDHRPGLMGVQAFALLSLVAQRPAAAKRSR